jgi:hypothetical protein
MSTKATKMDRRTLLMAAVVVALVSGCETTRTQMANSDDDDKTYVTGSRIPVRDQGAQAAAAAAAAKNPDKGIQDQLRRGGPGTGGVTGAGGS